MIRYKMTKLCTTVLLCISLTLVQAKDDESLAGSFFSGLLDTITSTADVKDCPGVCVHALATLICYEVLEDIPCPSGMKCCLENSTVKDVSTSLDGTATKASTSKSKTTKSLPTITTKKNILQPSTAQSKFADSEDRNSCKGVCVAERIAEYCEAYLTNSNFCKMGTKCCVSLDDFPLQKYPKDLYIPAYKGQNKTFITTSKPNVKTSEVYKLKNTTFKPTKIQKKKTTFATTQYEVQNDKTFEAEIDNKNSKSGIKECEGECVNGFLALFCDDIDSSSYCPADESCCITSNVEKDNNNEDYKITTEKPQSINPIPVSSRPGISSSNENLIAQILNLAENTFSQSNSETTITPIIKCPGFCILNLMSAFCERPARLISRTSSCKKGSVCCDNTKISSVTKLKLSSIPPTKIYLRPQTNKITTQIPDYREECPGSCIVPLLSFTCFHNAEMTDLFKCTKIGQTCCAQKTKIQEKQIDYIGNTSMHLSAQSQFQTISSGAQQLNSSAQYWFPPQKSVDIYSQTMPHHISSKKENGKYSIKSDLENFSNVLTTTSKTIVNTPSVYSKYVCGVKNSNRSTRSIKGDISFNFSQSRNKSLQNNLTKVRNVEQYHIFPERLILGTAIVPIKIQNDKLGDLIHTNFDKSTGLTETINLIQKFSRKSRVVGGEDGENGEWCWQVALINSLNQYLCGAALIGTQWVLTAAHCVTNIVRSGDAIYVRVGDYDLTRKFGSPGAQTLKVATTYIHHNHNSQTLDNDIALLKLHGQAELKDGVCLVCLPARGVNHVAGKRCIVTGYGYMGEAGPIPLRVREAELPVVSDAECIRKVNAVTEKIFILPASSFCAGGEEGNDACQGDGGGPFVCQDDGFYELVGLVSWGFGCGRIDVPGVYVKVSSFIGWINQIISVNN